MDVFSQRNNVPMVVSHIIFKNERNSIDVKL